MSAAVNIPRAVAYLFWQDEVGSARVITESGPVAMLRAVAGSENHPPGFYSLGWALHHLGVPVVWDRAISVLAAIALAGLVVVYAQRMLPLWAAGLAGLLVALGWQFWRHGWELRPYSLFALACLVFVLALEWTFERITTRRLVLLAVAVAVGSMTHLLFLLTLAGAVAWILLDRTRRERRAVLVAIGAGLVPLLVWSPALAKQITGGGYRANPDFGLRPVLDTYGDLLVRNSLYVVLSVVILGLVLIGSVRLWRLSDSGRLCALSAVGPVAAAAIVWLTGPDIYVVKNLIGAAPFAVVAIAAALTAVPRPFAIAATASAAVLAVVGYVDSRGRIVPDYDRVAAALVQQGWNERDPIVVFGEPYQLLHPLDWYLPGGRLELATWATGSCEHVYVVSLGGRGRALIAGVPTDRVRRFVVGRLKYRSGVVAEARRRHGHVLATRAAGCVRTT
jgi:hypothetical protein